VKVVDADSGRESEYTLVTPTESDPSAGRLSVDSPLARTLAGAKVGDEVAFEAPRGVRRLRVVAVG
jgi:transcription elongation factor GreA